MSAESTLKTGVDLRILAPQWGLAYPIIQQCFISRGYSCVVTSGNDGEHTPKSGKTSLHYLGRALDFRTKHLPMSHKLPLRLQVQAALGEQWDVVLEHVGMDNEHLHVEFDPKPPIEEAA